VVLENRVCGFIVAARQDLPWAYMISIQDAFDDIKSTLGTSDVRIPTVDEFTVLKQNLISRGLGQHHHKVHSSSTALPFKPVSETQGSTNSIQAKIAEQEVDQDLEKLKIGVRPSQAQHHKAKKVLYPFVFGPRKPLTFLTEVSRICQVHKITWGEA